MTPHSRARTGLIGLALTLSLVLPTALQAEGSVQLTFEPHCADESRDACPTFEVADPMTLRTQKLVAGDILDIDVVLTNAVGREAETVRSWLSYDAQVLEARNLELGTIVTQPLPGEETIDPTTGTVKIGGNIGSVTSDRTMIARVTFRVLSTAKDTTIRFNGFAPDGIGQTAVNGKRIVQESSGSLPAPCIGDLIGCRGVTNPLLTVEPTVLAVSLADAAAGNMLTQQTAGTESAATTQPGTSGQVTTGSGAGTTGSADGGPATGAGTSTFSLLQIQNLRVTTRDQEVFLGWLQLPSTELAGYNVYYGTVSGKYIQRRSVPSTAASLVLRDLQPDTMYFFAVRAFNAADQETVFSKEVAVTVGKPETSTSPLLAMPEPVSPSTVAAVNPLETTGSTQITGETGTADTFVIIAVCAALIGTAFAFARQLTLSRTCHVA